MRYAPVALLLALPFLGRAQALSLQLQPVFSGETMALEKPFRAANGDSLTLSTLKFYLGNFGLWKNGRVVFAGRTHHLLDLEDENSLRLTFNLPEKTDIDSLAFDLGVDSLTTASGAMGGDLDPTRGMFWTWQSGYINLKVEGFSSKCPTRAGAFAFHLGGYLPPFQTVRRVVVPLPPTDEVRLDFDLAPFFQKIDWQNKSGIMSPGAEAVRLMDVLAGCFRVYAD